MMAAAAQPAELEDLVHLSREIAALVRAGVPLESGLRILSNETYARGLAQRLAERMRSGASLPQALRAEGDRLPRVYETIVTSGLRSGRLPEALESLADFSESMRQLRARLRLAFMYPAIVVALAYALFVGFLLFVLPEISATYYIMRLPEGSLLPALEWLRSGVWIWGPALPIAVGLLLLLMLSWRRRGGITKFLPVISRIRLNYERHRFCHLLAMLLQNEVPLPEALELAAESIDDAHLRESAVRAAASVRQGNSLPESLAAAGSFTPVMRWMMSGGAATGTLAASLERAAHLYRDRAVQQGEWFRTLAPVTLVVFVGGSAVLAYGLSVFLPLVEMLDGLTVEPFR